MNHQEQIQTAFARLGFKPRPGQVEAVSQILTAFVDEKMQNVVLSAPTGTGKSIIGAVTAEALSIVRGLHPQAPKSSIMLVSTNVLSKQYETTFKKLADEDNYIQIKGASNYPCTALTTAAEEANAESCAWYTMVKAQSEFGAVMAEHCNKCEYMQVKKRKNTVRHLTTNYSYYFIDRMYTGKFEDRDLVVWDEAHLINDLFSEHNAIHFSQKRMVAFAEEITGFAGTPDIDIMKAMKQIAKDCAIKDKINDGNYVTYLNQLMKIYTYAKNEASESAERALRSGQMGQYSKYSKLSKKYEGLGCKIDDLFKYDYEHVFEWKEEDSSVSVKPIFVSTMFGALQSAPHNLFMSATVSGPFMVRTLGLDGDKTKFIQLPPTFPKENKEVVFFDPLSLSYTSLQNPATVKALRKNAAKIVKHHVDEGQRGIIIAPSFKLQEEVVAELNDQPWKKAFKLFEHRKGEKLEHVLQAFKAYKGGPAVLISPSIFEGIDLAGELSEFQIMLKAPFPSLGDKRIKWILDHAPDIYSTITAMKMVQGFGRSVRSETDHATSYCLDLNGQRLFTSATNVWKNEFNLRFTKFL